MSAPNADAKSKKNKKPAPNAGIQSYGWIGIATMRPNLERLNKWEPQILFTNLEIFESGRWAMPLEYLSEPI